MTALLAYCDPISVAPGERVRVMVSCLGAARYEAELVRLINPQAGPLATPFRTERIEHPANRSYPGRRQRVPIGSFGAVDPHPLIAGLASFTLQAYVWPTTPGRGRQALVGTWSEAERRGFGLGLDEDGALELRLGDGRRGREPQHPDAAAGAPLVPGRGQLRCRERPPRAVAGAARRPDLP